MHIGILQAGHTPDALIARRGDFDAMFRDLLGGRGFDFTSWDVERMAFPASVTEADGWLITGSRHGAYEDHPFIPPLEAFIRGAWEAGIPVAGICFGHQIVAQALGGRVEKFAGGWSLGRRVYETPDGREVALNAWHQDQVTRAPAGARTLAANDFCAHAALAYPDPAGAGRDRILTIQPHPEFSPALIGDYVATRRGTGTYPDDRMEAAAAQADDPVDNAAIGRAIARFFREGVAHV